MQYFQTYPVYYCFGPIITGRVLTHSKAPTIATFVIEEIKAPSATIDFFMSLNGTLDFHNSGLKYVGYKVKCIRAIFYNSYVC